MVESRDASPDDFQLRGTMRIWARNTGVGSHPVIFMSHSLFGGQQGQNGRYAVVSSTQLEISRSKRT